MLIIVRLGINNSDWSLVELTATTMWHETLYDSMQIIQLNMFNFADSRGNGSRNHSLYTDNTKCIVTSNYDPNIYFIFIFIASSLVCSVSKRDIKGQYEVILRVVWGKGRVVSFVKYHIFIRVVRNYLDR